MNIARYVIHLADERNPRAKGRSTQNVKRGGKNLVAPRLTPCASQIARPDQNEDDAYAHQPGHFLPVGGDEHDNCRAQQKPAKGCQYRTEAENRPALFKIEIQP